MLDPGAVAGAGRACSTRMPVPPQVWQGWLKENRPWLSLITPRPPQTGHTVGAGARRGAGPAAGVAGRLGGDVDGGGEAVDGVEERQVQAGLEVLAPLDARGAAGARPAGPAGPVAPAEDVAEQVAEVVDPEAAAGSGAAGRAAHAGEGVAGRAQAADLVVLLALGRVAEHVVGGRDLLEPVLGPGVGVGVVLLGQLAVGLADLLVGRRVGHPQHLVVVLLEPLTLGCHRRSPPHFDHGRPQDPSLPAVAGAQHLDDLLAAAVARLVGHGVVHASGRTAAPTGSIRSRPSRSSTSDRAPGSCLTSSPPPWARARSAVSSTGSSFSTRALGGPLEVVGLLLDHALLVVLEVGLQADERVAVVVALEGQGGHGVHRPVVIDLAGRHHWPSSGRRPRPDRPGPIVGLPRSAVDGAGLATGPRRRTVPGSAGVAAGVGSAPDAGPRRRARPGPIGIGVGLRSAVASG